MDAATTAEQDAERFRRLLAKALGEDPDMSGLRPAALGSGARLVDALADLFAGRSGLLSGIPDGTADDREDAFVARFVAAVGGDGGLIGDAVARRAARRTAERLLADDPTLASAVHSGVPSARVTGEVFCTAYRFFFGEFMGEFVRASIAESVPLVLPVDPTGLITAAVARKVVDLIPDPCDGAERRAPGPGRLAETARELVTDAVELALGLREEHP
ncbi:hypothetical protein GA0074694_2929 [Micromonospora inyonensis]|uniref:Uncharacterized protein n=1 Tax=Micromonospora inyonensis TaxID=47866 RepID=A0A1C6RSR1_9ACTN|nr:hypothetical protein GA0074694_2929 [Micromonospora inyonensis]